MYLDRQSAIDKKARPRTAKRLCRAARIEKTACKMYSCPPCCQNVTVSSQTWQATECQFSAASKPQCSVYKKQTCSMIKTYRGVLASATLSSTLTRRATALRSANCNGQGLPEEAQQEGRRDQGREPAQALRHPQIPALSQGVACAVPGRRRQRLLARRQRKPAGAPVAQQHLGEPQPQEQRK